MDKARWTDMGERSDGSGDGEFFAARYRPERSHLARRLERQALGHEVGLNGYTTVDEAQDLVEYLGLSPDRCLLDLGAGRGWPGLHIARTSRCRVITTDVPREALVEARRTMIGPGHHPLNEVLAAEGAALPFPGGFFNGIVHADVFC